MYGSNYVSEQLVIEYKAYFSQMYKIVVTEASSNDHLQETVDEIIQHNSVVNAVMELDTRVFWNIYVRQFYLYLMTMSQVGYGDSVSFPSSVIHEEDSGDYIVPNIALLIWFIYFSQVGFLLFESRLSIFFKNRENGQAQYQQEYTRERMNEFFLNQNQILNKHDLKQISYGEWDEMIDLVHYSFLASFNRMKKSEYY